VDGTGSGSCPMEGFGISGIKPLGSATRELVSKMDLTLEKWAVRMGGGWNWLRIVSNGRLWH
jgi:hypothetical protein